MAGDALPTGRQLLTTWVAIGLLVVSAIALRYVGSLLSSITGDRSFSPDVFTGFDPTPWSNEIHDALAVWKNDVHSVLWINLHLLIDLFIFAPSYCWLLYWLLRRVGAPVFQAAAGAVTMYEIDMVETTVTGMVVGGGALPTWLIPVLSLVKWLVLFALLVVVALCWASRRIKGRSSAQQWLKDSTDTWRGPR